MLTSKQGKPFQIFDFNVVYESDPDKRCLDWSGLTAHVRS